MIGRAITVKKRVIVVVSVTVLSVAVAAAMIATISAQATARPSGDSRYAGQETGFTPEGYPYRGSQDAPVLIKEYASFACGHCAHISEEMQALDRYVRDGRVRIEYHIVTFGRIGAATAAEAALCAGEQGRFWEYHDALFSSLMALGRGTFTVAHLQSLADGIGLDGREFSICLLTRRYRDRVQAMNDEAYDVPIEGTPTLIVNGRVYVGYRPADELVQIIEDALTGAGG